MFAERLKLLRTQKKMSQKELGQALGVSSSTIGMYEREKRTPDLSMVKAVSSFFEVSIDYLLGTTNDPVIKNLNSNEFHAL